MIDYIANTTRKIDYLRISVTDKCNLRCIYCMPGGGIANRPREELLTFEEIIRLARIFSSLGVRKIRLTGGEPLVRKELVNLVEALSKIDGTEELCLTTNATLLSRHAQALRRAGLTRVNISLDTLKERKFKTITGFDSLREALEGIDEAKKVFPHPVKLNTVIMKGVNDDEVMDFVDFAFSEGLSLRFIEFMKVTPLWQRKYFIPIETVKEICEKNFRLRKLENSSIAPVSYYSAEGKGILGFIKTDIDNCRVCNRLRLTSTGELKVCLYETEGLFLREYLRKGFGDEEIKRVLRERLGLKEEASYRNWEASRLYMNNVGG